MMIQETVQAGQFKRRLRDSLRHETQDSRAIKIAKHGLSQLRIASGRPSQSLSHSARSAILHMQRGASFSRSMPRDHRPTPFPTLQAALTLFGGTQPAAY